MAAATLNSRITVSPDVLFHTLDGEAVLLDLKSGKYFGLDAVGTRMWSLTAELGSPRAVVARLLKEYAVDESRLQQDVLNWVDKLAQRELVTVEILPQVMKSKLRKAWSLPASDWWLLARAWGWLFTIDLGLRLLPFKTLQDWLARGVRKSRGPRKDDERVIRHTALMVDRARRLHLYQMSCLRRSLTLQRLLASLGVETTLRFGVRIPSGDGRLQAHAWLEHGGRPVSEPEALADRYAALVGHEQK